MMDEDRAWVSVDTKLAPDELRAFCRDIERLLRLNPLLEVTSFVAEAGGFALVGALDGRHLATRASLAEDERGISLAWEGLLKKATRLGIEPLPQGGARLVIEDDYAGASEDERRTRLDEVDRSLLAWGQAIGGFLPRWRRWGGFGPWRWWTERFWLRMTPQGRRVARLIAWTTLAEFAVFLMVVAVMLAAE